MIEYLSEFDLVGEENTKEICWCGGVVKKNIDGIWVKPGKCRQPYKENEAAFVCWDAVPEADYPVSRSIEPFNGNKWNKNCDG